MPCDQFESFDLHGRRATDSVWRAKWKLNRQLSPTNRPNGDWNRRPHRPESGLHWLRFHFYLLQKSLRNIVLHVRCAAEVGGVDTDHSSAIKSRWLLISLKIIIALSIRPNRQPSTFVANRVRPRVCPFGLSFIVHRDARRCPIGVLFALE